MKTYFYILFFLKFNLYSQDYELVIKAERILNSENPDLKKAKKLLNRAKKADYGFCGNAKMTVISEIEYYDAKIYYLKGNYRKSLDILDSGATWIKQKSSDSLKVLCLTKMYGKTKIRDLIFEKSNEIIKRDSDYLYKKICLKLDAINYIFCFNDQYDKIDYKKEITILEIIEKSNFYKALIE